MYIQHTDNLYTKKSNENTYFVHNHIYILFHHPDTYRMQNIILQFVVLYVVVNVASKDSASLRAA